MLPRLARALDVAIEDLVSEEGAAAPARTRRDPPSRLKQKLNAISQLPKAKQRVVSEVLDAMLAQHGA